MNAHLIARHVEQTNPLTRTPKRHELVAHTGRTAGRQVDWGVIRIRSTVQSGSECSGIEC